uniref:Uncharacterized protein n=1 Tax=Nelumbo nucifera TaxID=4432 RepID=A0A822ZFM5_NELNU|nr:TPA_asm: hypothetical protein HUJ06_000469 [Nelumbo nucifera]
MKMKDVSFAGTFDVVGSTELQNAGKAGLVTVQGKISAVLGTMLICESILCFQYSQYLS